MTRWLPLICAILLATAVTLGWLWRDAEARLDKLTYEFHRPSGAALEARVVGLEAQYQHAPVQKIKDLLVPVTIRLPDRTCVELRPRWGVVGGTVVYCFRKSGDLIERHQLGE